MEKEQVLVAGHPPAVKVGGRRVAQHPPHQQKEGMEWTACLTDPDRYEVVSRLNPSLSAQT